VIFPLDKIEAIGSDEQLTVFDGALEKGVYGDDTEIERHEMQLYQLQVAQDSPLVGKTLDESGIRDKYDCMVVGLEEGKKDLSPVRPQRKFKQSDIIWLVGEENSFRELKKYNGV
jgi:CPA2 family monovalent cation:H+ antiporter-2